MCGCSFFEFGFLSVCYSFHLNLPRFVCTPAKSFLWLLVLKRVVWVGNYNLLRIHGVVYVCLEGSGLLIQQMHFFIYKVES